MAEGRKEGLLSQLSFSNQAKDQLTLAGMQIVLRTETHMHAHTHKKHKHRIVIWLN
jgi:hypothetical protein